MGQSYLAEGNNEEARKFFQEKLDINPRDLYGLNGMGQSYLAEGNNEEARKFFQEILKINPRDLYGIYGLSKIDFIEGKTNDASTGIKKCIQLSTNSNIKYLYATFLIACTPKDHSDFTLIKILIPDEQVLSKLEELAKNFKKNPTDTRYSPYNNGFWSKMEKGLFPVNKSAKKELIPYTEIEIRNR